MMIIVLFILLTTSIFSQNIPIKVNGGFNKCEVYHFNYKNGVVDSTTKIKLSIALFNKKGQILLDTIYVLRNNSGGKDIKEINNDNISNANLEQNNITNHSSKNQSNNYYGIEEGRQQFYIKIANYKYDNSDNLEEELLFTTIEDKVNYTYSYNKIGRIKEIIEKNNSEILRKYIFSFNEKDYKLDETIFNGEGSFLNNYIYYHDNEWKIIEAVRKENGTTIETMQYIYDLNKNLIIKQIFSTSGLDKIININYNENMNIKEEIVCNKYKEPLFIFVYNYSK